MADITKIQPMGSSTQYTLGARYLTTARTLTIGSTGKTFDGTANVSWTLSEIGAAAASHTHNYAASSHTHSYLPLSGGTMTGSITLASSNGLIYPNEAGYKTDSCGNFIHKRTTSSDTFNIYNNSGTSKFSVEWETGNVRPQGRIYLSDTGMATSSAGGWRSDAYGNFIHQNSETSNYWNIQSGAASAKFLVYFESGRVEASSIYGAVWNDYAEMRNVPEVQKDIDYKSINPGVLERIQPGAGRCVHEIGDGTMVLTTERLQKGCKIISDTYGFCIGENDNCHTPIAVTGRVLVYCNETKDIAIKHIGDGVCSGPNGTVSIMTEEEERLYPTRIVGTISEIPNYEIWHCGDKDTPPIKVNGRIWIYVR